MASNPPQISVSGYFTSAAPAPLEEEDAPHPFNLQNVPKKRLEEGEEYDFYPDPGFLYYMNCKLQTEEYLAKIKAKEAKQASLQQGKIVHSRCEKLKAACAK